MGGGQRKTEVPGTAQVFVAIIFIVLGFLLLFCFVLDRAWNLPIRLVNPNSPYLCLSSAEIIAHITKTSLI